MLAQFLHRTHGQQSALVDDRNAVTELFDLTHDVRRVDDALALFSQRLDLIDHVPCDEDIQPGCWFVEDQNGRIVNDRSRYRHLLLHAGRHLRSQHVADVVHREAIKQMGDPRLKRLFRNAVQATEVLDHLPRRHAVVDAGVVRHEPDASADLGRVRRHVVPGDEGGAAGWLQHGAEDA